MLRLTKLSTSHMVLIQTWDEEHKACQGTGQVVIHWASGTERAPCECYASRTEPDLAEPEE